MFNKLNNLTTMKRHNFLFMTAAIAVLMLGVAMFTGCEKDDDNDNLNDIKETSTGGSGSASSINVYINAFISDKGTIIGSDGIYRTTSDLAKRERTAELYTSQEDMKKRTNKIATSSPHYEGEMPFFTNLKANTKYWVYVESIQYTNETTLTNFTTESKNGNYSYDIPMDCNLAWIKLINNTSDSYSFSVAGSSYSLSSGSSKLITVYAGKNYTVNTVQLNGYYFYPTKNSYSVSTECGTIYTVRENG